MLMFQASTRCQSVVSSTCSNGSSPASMSRSFCYIHYPIPLGLEDSPACLEFTQAPGRVFEPRGCLTRFRPAHQQGHLQPQGKQIKNHQPNPEGGGKVFGKQVRQE